jgi:hypothetical protein
MGYRVRLWQAASAFAQRGLYREAIQLGTRVFKHLTGSRAGYAVELARWQVQAGEVESARSTCVATCRGRGRLRRARVCGDPGGLFARTGRREGGVCS